MPVFAVGLAFVLTACDVLRLPDIHPETTAAQDAVAPPLQPEVRPVVPHPKAKPKVPVAALGHKRQSSGKSGAAPADQNEQTPSDGGEAVANQDVPLIIGLNRDALMWHFGPPNAEREAPPARILEFGNDECRLAAYLYLDTARNDFYVLQYEVNGMTEHHPASEQCLARITRDAGRR